MATILKLKPADHGRPLTLEEFVAATGEEGFHYELIDGRLYVSHMPDPPQGDVEVWLFGNLYLYSRKHPEVINHVHPKARVFVPGRRRTTCPEPDVTAYNDYPLHLPLRERRWQDVSPVLVAEVLSPDDPDKDLVRNVELYLQVPTIKEYWVIDTRPNPDEPTMTVHRRHGKKWRLIEVSHGETYTTKLLPGFALKLDPRS
jgi:Uma2 family endonuclease